MKKKDKYVIFIFGAIWAMAFLVVTATLVTTFVG